MNKIQLLQLSELEKKVMDVAKEASTKYLNVKGNRYLGAAILGKNGKIYQGASIRRKNASSSTCAERMALDSAIFDGCFDYELLVTIGYHRNSSKKEVVPPCGTCRQILSEAETYGVEHESIPVIMSNEDMSEIIRTGSDELFPLSYR